MASAEWYRRQGVGPAMAEQLAARDEYEEELRLREQHTQPAPAPQPLAAARPAAPTQPISPHSASLDFATELAYLTNPAPCGANGRDATGLVVMRVDEQRLPVRIGVAEFWKKRVTSLEAAIMQAYSNALAEQRKEARPHGAKAAPVEAPPLDLSDYEGAPPRAIESYENDVLTALEKLDKLQEAPVSEKETERRSGVRTLDLEFNGHWLVNCRVNDSWAREAAAVTIMTEFSKVLTSKLEESRKKPDSRSPFDRRSNELVAMSQELTELTKEGVAALRYQSNTR